MNTGQDINSAFYIVNRHVSAGWLSAILWRSESRDNDHPFWLLFCACHDLHRIINNSGKYQQNVILNGICSFTFIQLTKFCDNFHLIGCFYTGLYRMQFFLTSFWRTNFLSAWNWPDRSYGGIFRRTDGSSEVARTELYTTIFKFYCHPIQLKSRWNFTVRSAFLTPTHNELSKERTVYRIWKRYARLSETILKGGGSASPPVVDVDGDCWWLLWFV